MSTELDVLLVEDNDADAESFQRVVRRLQLPIHLRRCATGACALDYLHLRGEHTNEAPRPAFILLDYQLPDMSGAEILEAIKATSHLKTIPVIAFSGSTASEPVNAMYRNGASSFVPKPADANGYMKTAESMMAYWLALVLLPQDEGGPARPS